MVAIGVREMGAAVSRGRRSSRGHFDGDRFVADVLAYTERFSVSRRELFAAAGIDLSTGLQLLRRQREPSLLTVCALADVCDLSLDAYRMPQ